MSTSTHLHISHQGSGPAILLSHALGVDMSMWDDVADTLSEQYSVTAYDHRGHGRSPVLPGPYTMHDLVEDAATLITEHFRRPVIFIGLSLGGMVGQLLAARHPDLVRKLVVANCPDHVPESAHALWQQRMQAVAQGGMAAIADATLLRWFTPEFAADQRHGGAQVVAATRETLLKTDASAYLAACAAVAGFDARQALAQIQAPTLVIGATRDDGTPERASRSLQQSIPGARGCVLPTAHMSALEQPQAFANAVLSFLES